MEKRILEIKRNLEKKTTESLRQIYQRKNTDEWSTEAFIAIESILNDRGVALQGNDISGSQHKIVLCGKCGFADFDYDSSWKEYSCNNCGWIAQDKEKISYLIASQTKEEDTDRKKISQEEFVDLLLELRNKIEKLAINAFIDEFEYSGDENKLKYEVMIFSLWLITISTPPTKHEINDILQAPRCFEWVMV